jgi:hypothetical protein
LVTIRRRRAEGGAGDQRGRRLHLTGRPNGYFGDAAIKILLPHQLKPLETGLRAIGYGPKVDQLVMSMNRAAEAAAPMAVPIFKRAIENMSFGYAQRIVSGDGIRIISRLKPRLN